MGFDVREPNGDAAICCTPPPHHPIAVWCTDRYAFAAFRDSTVAVCDLRKPTAAPLLPRLGAGLYLASLQGCAISTASSTVRLAGVFNLDTGNRVLRVMDFLPPFR